MGFSALASSRTTHTGSLQSLVSTGVNLTDSADTGTIDAATNWSSSISDGHAFAIIRAGAVVAVRCAKSVSTTRLTYFRLYLDDGSELATDVQVGDTITIYEQPEVVAAGSALSAVAGITLTSYGSAQLLFRTYNIGANAITTTGFLQIPSKHLLIFGPTAPPGLTLQSGANGRLAIGWYRTQGGVSAFCADLIIRGTYTAASNFNPVDSLLCTNSTSARVDWFGGVEESKAPSPANNDSLGTMIIYSKSCRAKGLDTVGNYQCRIQSSNFRSYGLTIENRSFALLALAVLNGFKPINCDQAIAMAAGSPAGYTPVTGADLRGGNILDIGYRADKKVRLINHKRGSAIIPGGNTSTADIQNRGVHEIRQETTVFLRNLAGSDVNGARVFMRDTDNGNRLAASTFTGSDDYIADRTYEGVTSSGSVSFTTNGGVLLADVYQNVANVAVTRFQDIVWDYRSRNNNSTDVFRFGYAAYGYLPATVDAALQGDVPYVVSAVPIADSAITEATQATVAAYTALETLAKVYDYSCHWLTLSGANMETAGLGQSLLSFNGGVLDCGSLNVVIDATAVSIFTVATGTMTVKASSLSGVKIQTTGTISFVNGATADAALVYVDATATSVPIVVGGVRNGSKVRVVRTDTEAELAIGTAGASGFVARIAWTTDLPIRADSTYTSGLDCEQEASALGTLTANGALLTVVQEPCTIYEQNNIDGDTVSGLTLDAPNVEVDADEVDNTMSVQEMFAWYKAELMSDAGIRTLFGAITAENAHKYRVNASKCPLKIDQKDLVNTLLFTGGLIYRDDGESIRLAGSGSIEMIPNDVYESPEAEQSLAAIKAKTDNLPASPANEATSAAIKAKTDSLAFTVPGQVDANIQYVNDVAVTGNGQAGTEWGPG